MAKTNILYFFLYIIFLPPPTHGAGQKREQRDSNREQYWKHSRKHSLLFVIIMGHGYNGSLSWVMIIGYNWPGEWAPVEDNIKHISTALLSSSLYTHQAVRKGLNEKKKRFLSGIARMMWGGGLPMPEFVGPFFHHVFPYILTSISCYLILFGHF